MRVDLEATAPSSVQAYLPRRALNALDIALVVRMATLAGVDRPCIESSTHKIPANIPAGSTRVTCSVEMALVLVEALRQQAVYAEEREDGELLSATAEAAGALVAAIEEHHRPLGSTGTASTPLLRPNAESKPQDIP